jgi:hypothetical protein
MSALSVVALQQEAWRLGRAPSSRYGPANNNIELGGLSWIF